MSIIIWKYLKDNFFNITFHIIMIPYLINIIFYIHDADNTILVKIFTFIINVVMIIILCFLCYSKRSEFKFTISIKDLIKLNRDKKYQYQKLIKEKKFKYIKYIKYIDEDIQLKIFNGFGNMDGWGYNQYDNQYEYLDYWPKIYLQDIINPSFNLIYEIVLRKPELFYCINKKCDNYKEYKELYKFMII